MRFQVHVSIGPQKPIKNTHISGEVVHGHECLEYVSPKYSPLPVKRVFPTVLSQFQTEIGKYDRMLYFTGLVV